MSININNEPFVKNITILLNANICSVSLIKKPHIFDAILLNTNKQYKKGYKQDQIMQEYKNYLVESLNNNLENNNKNIKYWKFISLKWKKNITYENIIEDILDNNYLDISYYIDFLSYISNLNIIIIDENGKFILSNNIKLSKYFIILILEYSTLKYNMVGIKSDNGIDIQTIFSYTNPILENILNSII